MMEILPFDQRNMMDYNFNKNSGNSRKRKCTYIITQDEFGVPVKQRSQANARERDRTHSVNSAFTMLRTLIPTEPKDRKLSKIETLRLASSYISHLGMQLLSGNFDQPCLVLKTNSKLEPDRLGLNRNNVCTFCMANKRYPKIPFRQQEFISCGSNIPEIQLMCQRECIDNNYSSS